MVLGALSRPKQNVFLAILASMSPIVNLAAYQQFAAINLNSDLGHVRGEQILPLCAEIRLTWNQEDGKQAHNVLHGRYATSFNGTVAQANAIMTALTTGAAWTAYAGFLATQTQFAAVAIRDRNALDQPYIISTNAPVSGTSVSASLPNEVAAVMTLPTAKAGPRYRGRMYLPGFATNALGAGNLISNGAATAMQNWYNLIAGAFTAQGYTFCLGLPPRAAYDSPRTGAHFDARPAETPAVVGGGNRDFHWDSQRRRGLR